jgi:hypothetical protein
MLQGEHIHYLFNNQPKLAYLDDLSYEIYGVSISALAYELKCIEYEGEYDRVDYIRNLKEVNEMYILLNNMWVETQTHLRVEYIKKKGYVEVEIYIDDDFHSSCRESPSSYKGQTAIKLYKHCKMNDGVYKQMMSKVPDLKKKIERDEILKDLLDI